MKKFDKEYIETVYNLHGGPKFLEVSNYIESLVPAKILVNEVVCNHFSAYYNPSSELFAYLFKGEIIYYTKERANSLNACM